MRHYLVRSWRWWLAAILLVAIVTSFLLMWYCGSARSRYERIEVGMTRDEAEAILGGPPGDHGGGDGNVIMSFTTDISDQLSIKNAPFQIYNWHYLGGVVILAIDRKGIVRAKEFYPKNFWQELLNKARRLIA